MIKPIFGLALSALAFCLAPVFASAESVEYEPGLVSQQQALNRTLFLKFKSDWCGTCQAQERVLAQLAEENPDYSEHILFVSVDWETFGRSEMVQDLNVLRRSTLLALKGDEEIGRLIAGTRVETIKDLLDQALAAAVQ